MYVRISRRLGLNLPSNLLKAIVSVVIAEIAAVQVTTFLAENILSLIPGPGTAATMILAGLSAFAAVDAAGKSFLLIARKLFKCKTSQEIDAMSTDGLRQFARGAIAKKIVKDELKEATKRYEEVKNDPEYKKRAEMIHPEADAAN